MLPFPALPRPSRLLCGGLNALLKREEWARDRLARHAGKTVRFSFGRFELSLTVDAQGYAEVADAAIVPDVTLTLDSARFSLARLLGEEGRALARASARERADAFAGMTHISGDAGLAQVVAELAANLRWDVEDELARVVGDIPATRLTQGVRGAARGAREAVRRVGDNVAEFLSYEQGMLANRPVVEGWRGGIARAAAGADALAARLARLDARLSRLDGGKPAGGVPAAGQA
ncbi:ubiquinone biosynthesis accessory factor UbiJ [Achromobacter aloeverae]